MTELSFYDQINGHNIGVLMRAAVDRACNAIRKERFNFTAEEKVVEYKKETDYVTSADKTAQKIYLDFLGNNFPKFGVIAEEGELFKDAFPFWDTVTNTEHFFYFTIDPLDGTKAFKRKQSDGFSTMLGLIHSCPEKNICEVVAACIGDPMTKEVFYTRPNSERVHQLDQFSNEREILGINPKAKQKELYVLLRDNPKKYTPLARKVSDGSSKYSFFKDFELQGGSIGISFAKLWKGQYGGLILRPGKTTVWDTVPVVGISEKLGFVPMVYDKKQKRYVQKTFKVIATRDFMEQEEMLIIHKSMVRRLMLWQKKHLK